MVASADVDGSEGPFSHPGGPGITAPRAAGVGGAARLGYVPPLAPAPLEAGLSPFAGADHGQYRDDRGRGSRASR